MPLATVGADRVAPLLTGRGPVHSGEHNLGVPEQLVTPEASKANTLPSFESIYTTPLAIVGEASEVRAEADHKGRHVLGVPEQLVTPAASNAYRLLSPDPM